MNKDEIQLARKKCAELKYTERKEELEQLKQGLELLMKSPDVKKYIELSGLLEQESQKNSNIVEEAFGNLAENTKNSGNLLVFIGFYSSSLSNENLSPLKINNLHARYKYYVDIETFQLISISIKRSEEFEKNNNVIYLDDPGNYHHSDFYLDGCRKLRLEFFKHLVDNSQEETVKRFINKR